MKHLTKGQVSHLSDHLNSGLQEIDQSHLHFTKFTIAAKADDEMCKKGFHKEFVPVGDGSFELRCVPDNP
jgi:hypothetical protein